MASSGLDKGYLHTLHADMEDTTKFGYMNAGYDDSPGNLILTNPQARFYFERSKKNEPGFYHIRCGYNNKYWVGEEVTGGRFVGITTTSDRQEDMSKPLCTLFNVELRANGKDIADNNLYDARYISHLFIWQI
jgi:hypothetical protein